MKYLIKTLIFQDTTGLTKRIGLPIRCVGFSNHCSDMFLRSYVLKYQNSRMICNCTGCVLLIIVSFSQSVKPIRQYWHENTDTVLLKFVVTNCCKFC